MNENAIGETWNGIRLMNGDAEAERSCREARRHGGITAHADYDFSAFASKNAASGYDSSDGGGQCVHLANRRLPGPRTRANQFDAFAAGGRETRFKAEIAADEHAIAVEFLSVGRKDFERRENMTCRAASRYGHAPFFKR
jgi:hypothetical protein